MSESLQNQLGNAMIQALFFFDGSPERVTEMCELATVTRFFGFVEYPHPDTRRVLSRYIPMEELEWTEEKEELSRQKSAIFEMMQHCDVATTSPPIGAFMLIEWWRRLTDGLPLPQQAALICDLSIPLDERMQMLHLLV